MGSHSGKREKRKAREAERYWRLKKDYDDRISRLEERRRQIIEQLEPGSVVSESSIRQPMLTSLRENCLRVRESLKEVLQTCDSMQVLQSSHLKAVGECTQVEEPSESEVSEEIKSSDKKNRVLVFKSDGTLKGQHKGKGSSNSQAAGEYLPQMVRLKNSAQVALQEIEELLNLLVETTETQQVLPAETTGNLEDGDLEGMLDILKSPMVAELVGSLLTSLKK